MSEEFWSIFWSYLLGLVLTFSVWFFSYFYFDKTLLEGKFFISYGNQQRIDNNFYKSLFVANLNAILLAFYNHKQTSDNKLNFLDKILFCLFSILGMMIISSIVNFIKSISDTKYKQ